MTRYPLDRVARAARDGRLNALLRVRIADRLHSWISGDAGGYLTADFGVRSIQEFLYVPVIRSHVMGWRPWRQATIERYDLPEDLQDGFRRLGVFDERRLWLLEDVNVTPDRGLVWFPGGPVAEESVGALRRLIGWDDMRYELLRPPARLQGDFPVVAMGGPPFFHWLTEVVPGVIRAAQHDPDVRVLISDRSPGYVAGGVAWLRQAGVLRRSAIVRSAPVRAPHVLMPSMPEMSGFTHPQDVAVLRDTFGPTITPRGPEKLYISRRGASKRALAGEVALERALASLGFAIVRLEEHQLARQAALLAAAREVVAPHGGGLAHLVWCQPGTRVTEIFPAGFVHDAYARLAVGCGLDYQAVWAERDGTVAVDVLRDRLRAEAH